MQLEGHLDDGPISITDVTFASLGPDSVDPFVAEHFQQCVHVLVKRLDSVGLDLIDLHAQIVQFLNEVLPLLPELPGLLDVVFGQNPIQFGCSCLLIVRFPAVTAQKQWSRAGSTGVMGLQMALVDLPTPPGGNICVVGPNRVLFEVTVIGEVPRAHGTCARRDPRTLVPDRHL